MKTYKIKVNGKLYEVELEEVVTSEELISTTPKEKKVGRDDDGVVITAPMQGNMWKILVAEEETVVEGQVVAILEAMKMENEILAPCAGSIKSILVDAGDSVNLGEDLIVIKS